MTLLSRKRTVKVAIETVKGTQVAGTLAVSVFDLNINPTAPFAERKSGGNYIGHNEGGTLGERIGTCSFNTEMRVDGSGNIDPTILALLQGCGMLNSTGTLTSPTSSIATQKTLSIDVYEDGKKKGLYGAMGTVTITGEYGKKLMLNFEFTGNWVTPTDAAMPTFTPTGYAVFMKNGTFSIGGTEKRISKCELNPGNQVIPLADVNSPTGVAYFGITDTDTTIGFDLEAELVATYDINGIWLAGTTAAVVLECYGGTDTVTFTMPVVEYREIPEGDRDGIIIYDVNAQCRNSSGDDAITISAA